MTAPTMPVRVDELHVTKGAAPDGKVNSPTFRAVMPGTSGDAVSLAFVYRGWSHAMRLLASGQERRQIGLKLRAANSCNLVYVMWRMDPMEVEVSVKANLGKHLHSECGVNGYTKIHPSYHADVSALVVGSSHAMSAEIVGDELLAWIDGRLVWRGQLPGVVHSIAGPSGIRSDNVAYDIIAIRASSGRSTDVVIDDED